MVSQEFHPPPAYAAPAAHAPLPPHAHWAAAGGGGGGGGRRGAGGGAAGRYGSLSLSGGGGGGAHRGYAYAAGGGPFDQDAGGLTDLDPDHELYDTMASIFSADATEDAPLPAPRDAHRARMAAGGGGGATRHAVPQQGPPRGGGGGGPEGEDAVPPLPVLAPTGGGRSRATGAGAPPPPGAGTPVRMLRRRGLSLDIPGAHRELAQTLAATGALAGPEEAEAFSNVFEQLATTATGADLIGRAAAAGTPGLPAAQQVGVAAAADEGAEPKTPVGAAPPQSAAGAARSPAVAAIRAAVGGPTAPEGPQLPAGYQDLPRADSASKYLPRPGHVSAGREGFFDITPTPSAAAHGDARASGAGAAAAAAPPAAGAAGGFNAARPPPAPPAPAAAPAAQAQAPAAAAAVAPKALETMTVRDLLGLLVSTLQQQQGSGASGAAADVPVGRLLARQ
jgi:hypothetical protein